MDEKQQNNLAKLLAEDEIRGFHEFRRLFFDALEHRRLNECAVLLNVLNSNPSTHLHREVQYHRSILQFERRQFDQAEASLRSLLDDELSPDQRARTLLELGLQLLELGQWTEAEALYHAALKQYQSNENVVGQAKTYNNLGICICFQVEQGVCTPDRLQESLSCHETALELLQEMNEPWEVARNWHGIGRAYGLMGQYALAQNAFQTDLALSQAQNDRYAQSISLSDLAVLVYEPQKQLDEAADALEQAIDILRDFDGVVQN
ncbi:tetratricopeptide repeat protein [Chloroflexi bacterium TSY]|nr:tetratricopeptide repeat protein [Chloroflexi bacterium TSY]